MEKLTLDRNELANLLGVSVETLVRRRRDGAVLDPLPVASKAKPLWSVDEVKEWLRAGTPSASDWREQRREVMLAR